MGVFTLPVQSQIFLHVYSIAKVKDSEGLEPVDPSNKCLSQGQAFQSYQSPNNLVWSDKGEEDKGGLRPQTT